MNIKKVMAAGMLAVTAGMTLGMAANVDAKAHFDSYVVHSDGTLSSPMIVIGDTAGDPVNYPKDVVAAADIAATVAGHATTPVTTTGSDKSFSFSGEGQDAATANTKIFLDDSLGKSGLRSTMTDTDLPNLLASSQIVDENSTTLKYDQFLFLTPSSTTAASYTLQFERPSSSSADDGTYSFGRFPTSPTNGDYFANYRLSFKKDADFSAMVGETFEMLGETFTVLAESTSVASTPKLVTTKAAAAQSLFVSDGEVDVVVGDVTHTVAIVGTQSATSVVVSVNGESKSATKGATTNINGVDVYVDDVFHLSTSDISSNGAKLLIGAEKTQFVNGTKIKIGSDEDNVDGTYVVLTVSAAKVTTMDVYFGAPASSVTDNLRQESTYTLPVFGQAALHFPGISEDLMGSSRSVLKIIPSGDNQLQLDWTDFTGDQASFIYAYKAQSTDSQFRLADSSGNNITVVENQPVSQDEFVVLDAGDFPHFMKVTNVGTDSLSFTLLDMFSGDSVKYELASSDVGAKTIYIDGQAYQAVFDGAANTTINFTWGDGASGSNANADSGDATTVWPTLKGKNSERLAFINGENVTINATNGKELQLPTGAVSITTNAGLADVNVTLTAITDEDGESSACTSTPCLSEFSIEDAGSSNFTLGKTATGGVNYGVQRGTANNTFTITVLNTVGTPFTQPTVLLFEEKDDSSDRYSVMVAATSTASSGNNLVDAATPVFTGPNDKQTRGSDSNIDDHVDLFGTFVVENKNDQNSVTIYYPDDQVHAIVGAGDASGTASVGGTSGSTVDAAVVITSPVAKLANEVSTASLSSDLILIGGPCANTLVAELAEDTTSGVPSCADWSLTTGLIKEVANAFGSGQKALVVAGTTADDTRDLAKMVQSGTLDFEV